MSQEESENKDLLENAINISNQCHEEHPRKYYFGEGEPEFVKQCKEVLRILKSTIPISELYISEDSIIDYPIFKKIHKHISQIQHIYQGEQDKLINIFIEHLFPKNPLPLRHKVLISSSLFSARVYIHESSLQPTPHHAYIDGYYNLVIRLNDNLLRIPLLIEGEDDQLIPPTIPNSIRFVSDIDKTDSVQKEMNKYLCEIAPERGRSEQLHLFISILNRNNSLSDFLPSLMSSIASPDLTFAIAITTLASEPNNILIVTNVFNILSSLNLLDHYFRCLITYVIDIGIKTKHVQCPESISLQNIFISFSIQWIRSLCEKFKTKQNISLEEIIFVICNDINNKKDIQNESLYMLKAALSIAAYADESGFAAIAFLLEIIIWPFVKGLHIEEEFVQTKIDLSQQKENVIKIRNILKKTILNVLNMKISIVFYPEKIEDQVIEIHNFITQKINLFIKLVIYLNSRKLQDSPLFHMMKFSYTICNELDDDD